MIFQRLICVAVAWIAGTVFAEDGWGKVQGLASGTELRIHRTGTKAPVLATMDRATEDSLIVATKTEQISIGREQIEKIEFRPKGKATQVVRESRTDNTPLNRDAARASAGPARTPGPAGSASSGISLSRGKPEFTVLWVRGRRD